MPQAAPPKNKGRISLPGAGSKGAAHPAITGKNQWTSRFAGCGIYTMISR